MVKNVELYLPPDYSISNNVSDTIVNQLEDKSINQSLKLPTL